MTPYYPPGGREALASLAETAKALRKDAATLMPRWPHDARRLFDDARQFDEAVAVGHRVARENARVMATR